MDSTSFLNTDFGQICGVCNKEVKQHESYPMEALILENRNKDSIKAYNVLESISLFKFSLDGPQRLCSICFKNTVSAYKFQQMCNKSQDQRNAVKEVKPTPSTSDEGKKEEMAQIKKKSTTTTQQLEHDTRNEEVNKIEVVKQARNNDAAKDDENYKFKRKSKVMMVTCEVCKIDLHKFDLGTHLCNPNVKENPTKSKSVKSAPVKHEMVPSANGLYKCPYCDKSFKHRSTFVMHERSHTGERPFQCQFCVKAFPTKQNLQQHLLVHTREKAYTCDFCSKSFRQISHLNVHLQIYEGNGSQVCKVCGKMFTKAGALKKHLCEHDKHTIQEVICNALKHGRCVDAFKS